MPRIRWYEPDHPGGTPALADWRVAAATTAPLFLNNFFFYNHGRRLEGFGSMVVDIAIQALSAALLTASFFAGPALAIRRSGLSLWVVVEASLGSVPAGLLRFAAMGFLLTWAAQLISFSAWPWWTWIDYDMNPTGRYLVAAALTTFLLLTLHPGARGHARQALFSSKLGIAMLIAAAIRVREGWTGILAGSHRIDTPLGLNWTAGVSDIGLYAAPFGLLAAALWSCLPNRKAAVLALTGGVALPLFLSLAASEAIAIATYAAGANIPSLPATINMALLGNVSRVGGASRHMILVITVWGAIRFGLRAWPQSAPDLRSRIGKTLAGIAILALFAAAARDWFDVTLVTIQTVTAKCLALLAAVLTADYCSGRRAQPAARRVDVAGFMSLSAGLAVALLLKDERIWALNQWWQPWLPPAYLTAFT